MKRWRSNGAGCLQTIPGALLGQHSTLYPLAILWLWQKAPVVDQANSHVSFGLIHTESEFPVSAQCVPSPNIAEFCHPRSLRDELLLAQAHPSGAECTTCSAAPGAVWAAPTARVSAIWPCKGGGLVPLRVQQELLSKGKLEEQRQRPAPPSPAGLPPWRPPRSRCWLRPGARCRPLLSLRS